MTDRPNAHDALLGATSELTYEYGITGTGVDAIAARAGVTKRTLYQHFGSKDRLVAEALNDRNRRALLALETNARRRSEETGELAILALFDVIENALRTKTKAGCAFINASLEINRPGHPVREAALAHLRAREGLVQQLLAEAGVEDADLAAQVTLLVDGAYAVGGSRRDPAAARHAKAAAAALLAMRGFAPASGGNSSPAISPASKASSRAAHEGVTRRSDRDGMSDGKRTRKENR
jgi:AcrR family transcriptional regulator